MTAGPPPTDELMPSAKRDPLPRAADRVVLRRLDAADLAAFQAYRCDEAVGRYQGWTPQTDREAQAFLEEMRREVVFPSGAWLQLAVAARDTDELVGDVGICVAADGLWAELGFTIAPRFQGRGLGTEAVQAAIGLVFEHASASRVVCITDARNHPSIRLLERAGLHRVATAETVFRGEPCTEHTYAVDRQDAT